MIVIYQTDRDLGDDGDSIARGDAYYRVAIDDAGKVRVFELTNGEWEFEWTPIEDGCDPELEEEIKAEALDHFVERMRRRAELDLVFDEDWSGEPYFDAPCRVEGDQ